MGVTTQPSATGAVTAGLSDGRPARGVPADGPDPRVRGAGVRPVPRRRGPRLRPPVDRPGGHGGGRLLAADRDRRHHLEPPRARPLPGQGARPRADDGRAVRPGHRDEQGPGRVDAHRRPRPRHLRRQRDRGRRACRSPTAPRWPVRLRAAARRRGRRSSATARSRRAPSTRRPTWPRCGSCRWSSSARTTGTRSSRRSPTSTRSRWPPARPGSASTTCRSTATTSRRSPPR